MPALKNDFERELEEKMKEVFQRPIALTITVFNFEPTPEQARLLHAKGRIILLAGEPLTGKTSITLAKALWFVLNQKGKVVCYVVSSDYERRRIELLIRNLMFATKFLRERVVSIQDGTYTFDTGSRLILTNDLKSAQKKLPDMMIVDDAHNNKSIKELDPKKTKTLIITYDNKKADLKVTCDEKIELKAIK